MQPHSNSIVTCVQVYFLVMGLIMLAGGVMGFVKARSVASLVAGAVSGFCLLLSAYLMPGHVKPGLVLALVICLGLAGRFVPAFFRGRRMPAAYVAPLAVIGVFASLLLLILLAAAKGVN